jgi:hypothetical protein
MGPLEWMEELVRTLWQIVFMLVMGPCEIFKDRIKARC